MENREEFRMPEWGSVERHVLLWLLIVCLGMATSCSRKVSKDVLKTTDKQTQQQSSEGQVKKESGSEVSKSSDESKSETSEYWQKKIEENFNPDGTLKSRTTTEEKASWSLLVKKTLLYKRTQSNRIDSTFKTNVTKTTYKTVLHRQKDVETKSNQLAWVAFALGVIGLAFWLKPWMK